MDSTQRRSQVRRRFPVILEVHRDQVGQVVLTVREVREVLEEPRHHHLRPFLPHQQALLVQRVQEVQVIQRKPFQKHRPLPELPVVLVHLARPCLQLDLEDLALLPLLLHFLRGFQLVLAVQLVRLDLEVLEDLVDT